MRGEEKDNKQRASADSNKELGYFMSSLEIGRRYKKLKSWAKAFGERGLDRNTQISGLLETYRLLLSKLGMEQSQGLVSCSHNNESWKQLCDIERQLDAIYRQLFLFTASTSQIAFESGILRNTKMKCSG